MARSAPNSSRPSSSSSRSRPACWCDVKAGCWAFPLPLVGTGGALAHATLVRVTPSLDDRAVVSALSAALIAALGSAPPPYPSPQGGGERPALRPDEGPPTDIDTTETQHQTTEHP